MALALITDTVSVYRLARTGAKEAYAVDPALTGLDCQITPASTETLAVYGGNPSYSLYELYFDENVQLKNGDKLTTLTGTAYIVRDVPMRVENRLLSYTKIVAEVVL
jgi:hypothetical protein